MLSYIIRRLLLVFPTLIGITVVVFGVMAMSPGGISAPLTTKDSGMSPEVRKALQAYLDKRYGINDPAYVQYGRWLNKISPVGFKYDVDYNYVGFGFKWPDLGESFVFNRPVTQLIAEHLPITLLLNTMSIPFVYAIAIGVGMYSARYRGKFFDIATGTLFLALWPIPTIWAGVLLIGFFASSDFLQWFPANGLHDLHARDMSFLPFTDEDGWHRGWLLDMMWHLCLPVICLSYGSFAFLTKLNRTAVLENLSADFVRTARAKGVSDTKVLFRHVLRNSLIPLITVAAHILPSLLAGSVIVESIFGIQGMGKLTVEAITLRDREVVLTTTLISGLLGLAGYLIADILYAIADPRVSYES